MSIQTTIFLTRADAEQKYVDKNKDKVLRELRAQAVLLDDSFLEDAIEEDLYNYTIVEDDYEQE